MKYSEKLTLQGYGVTLRRLTHDKIELVRQWRNDPKISQYMFFKDYITPEMQEIWFHKINNDNNFYFIIEFDGKEIGLINIKDIDWENGCGETGVFIYDDVYLNSDIAYRAHLVMFDFVFCNMGIKNTFYHITNENTRARRFMAFLGGKQETEDLSDTLFFLLKEDYLNNYNRQRFIKRWNFYNK